VTQAPPSEQPAVAQPAQQAGTPASHDVIIHTRGLTKQFNDEYAVRDVSFDVPRGSIFGFIGPSGSGKTTTIRLLTGVYEPSAGEALVLGKRPMHFTQSTREKIGYMPQFFVLYPQLTVWENLNFAANIYGMSLFGRGKRLKPLLEFVELEEHAHKLASQISGGMKRRLSLAATLIHNPALIFLDEPTAGVDPVLRSKFWDHFRELQNAGRTLFVTTQYVSEAAYCDLVGVMGEGRLLVVDTPARLRQQAYGGDIVDITTTDRFDYQRRQMLRELPFVRRITPLSDTSVRLTVEEASTAIPAIVEWGQQQDVNIDSTKEYVPPFDDVFVEIVKRATPESDGGAS
jgi:ABC-2 type transport system ATP-binding protein